MSKTQLIKKTVNYLTVKIPDLQFFSIAIPVAGLFYIIVHRNLSLYSRYVWRIIDSRYEQKLQEILIKVVTLYSTHILVVVVTNTNHTKFPTKLAAMAAMNFLIYMS